MKPLKNIKVIEFCHVAAGPFSSMSLADMGADVIKVEPESGDSMRAWPPLSEGFSENFASLNRNKRSITLNLKSEFGLEAARRLIAGADVVVENNRPGVMKRLGLSYEAVKELNPKLVYCSVSAFGQTGPRANDGGFDVTVQAASGIMSVTGEQGGAPVKAGVPVSDFCAGLYAAYTITCLLKQVAEGGEGGFIDMSMLGASLGVSALQTSEYFGTGIDPKKLGSAHPRNAPYQAFKAKDDYFVLAAGNDKLWSSVCDVVNLKELVKQPRFLTTTDRAKNQSELKEILEACFAMDVAEVWVERLRAVGVPCEPINTYSKALEDPQVEHSGWVSDLTLASGAKTKTFGYPALINGKNLPIYRTAPGLGEHNDEILSEIGLKAGQGEG
ncbi:CaiB/BaiF CoA transferase family protein [Marinomonas algicola]|uniref:CaiB/BaiF CoA transferase family protein n=1 Tax=Marinomonas algicola TaxID=2773454 RepID=UPI001748C42D|nr:CoA transferase [Marinomonas algicola]